MVMFADLNQAGVSGPAPEEELAGGKGAEDADLAIVDRALTAKRTVLVVENERDAEALRERGAAAIRLPSGQRLRTLAPALAGGEVSIVVARRARSHQAAVDAARVLTAAGASTRIIGLRGCARGEGLAGWLSDGGTLADLEAMSSAVPPWQPPALYRSLAAILADPAATELPQAVVSSIAYRGRSTLLAAREKSGKSTLARGMLAAVSSGGEFFGEVCRIGTVLLIGLEEHVGDIARTLQAFGADPHRVMIVEPDALRGDDPIGVIERIVEHVEPDLVVIDTLAALTALLDSVPDAGDAGRWTAIMSRLTGLARATDAAVVILHHARKKDGRYRDSSAIGGGVDMILEVQEKGDDRKVSGRGRWPFDDFVYGFDGRVFRLVSRSRSIDAQVLDFIARTPGASQRQVEQAVTGKREAVREIVQKLLEEGAIEDRGTGRGRALHRIGPRPGGAPSGSGCSTSRRPS